VGPNEAVVAGSPEFVDAMLPLFTERFGGAPRVADSPHLASALCQDGARLLVYEHGGREWLPLCAELRGVTGPDLVVVVALPPEHAGDVAEISASASAVVAWRGQGLPVLDAASRVMAARDAPPAPPRRTGPVPTPQPGKFAVRPAPTPDRLAPAMPPPRPVMTPAPRPAVAPPGPLDALFDEEAAAAATTSEPAAGAAVPAAPPLSAPAPLAVWPGTVLSAVDGQAVVRAALSGLWPEQRLRAATEKLVAGLSTAEKAATLGQKLPFDPAPVRRAVGLRWQMAAALDTLPVHGAQVDQESVQAILGGIDDVLASLKILSDDARPEDLRALEAVRHALVKEAIDLTEALAQVLPAEVVEEITTSRRARKAQAAPVTRMVYEQAAPERERRQVPWGLVVVLVIAIAGAAAYHGYRYVNRPKQAASQISGAPSGTVGSVSGQGKVVMAPAGVKLDPKEVENFKSLERAKGNQVREILPGTFVVKPESAASGTQPEPGRGSSQGAKP
jgi:hypothetical protein